MEEADKILISSLKQLGVVVNALGDFDAPSFIQCIILCFERLSRVIDEQDQFIDLKFLKSKNLKEATQRFKLCQKFTEYLKHLGFSGDITLNSFLYPNTKDTRKLLSFLFDLIFQGEGDKGPQQKTQRPTNEYREIIKRRMQQWKRKPWVLPEFIEGTKRNQLVGGETIKV